MNFIFARRFFWLLALGLLPLSFSWMAPALVDITIGYNLLLFLAAWFDNAQTGRLMNLQVERHVHHHLSLDAKNPVTLRLWNHSLRAATIQLEDEYPPEMEASHTRLHGSIGPAEALTLSYTLRPNKRGDFQFGKTVCRVLGPYKLVWRQIAFNTGQQVRVYPNFRQARHLDLYAHRHRQMLVGQKRQRFRGHGREFESLRDFVTGDEIRHIAWTATARRGRLITRQYQIEQNQNLMIMLDTGRLMKAQIDRLSKLDHAINAALALAYVGLSGNDNVGLLIFNRHVRAYVPPHHRPRQLNVLLETLYNVEAELVESNYAQAFQYFTARNKKRSLVVILTDIIDRESSEQMLAYTSLLTTHHLPLLVTISDVDLHQLVQQIPAKLADVYQQAVAEELLHQRRQALAHLSSRGGLVLDVPAGNMAVELVNQYLEIKEQGLL